VCHSPPVGDVDGLVVGQPQARSGTSVPISLFVAAVHPTSFSTCTGAQAILARRDGAAIGSCGCLLTCKRVRPRRGGTAITDNLSARRSGAVRVFAPAEGIVFHIDAAIRCAEDQSRAGTE
jgi:hypothetical protein